MTIESSKDPERFIDFEHDGWERVSRHYEEHFSRLTSQSVDAVLDAALVTGGKHVLDVCCGPGMIAAAAVARGARTEGIDFSAAVVDIAVAKVPGSEFHVGDAQSLPFAENTFDAVMCGFGIIHVPDPQQALSEMHRVLKPGGRVAVSVWESPIPGNGFGLLYGAIKAHADLDVGLPHGPDFFQFSEPEKLVNALGEVGFNDASVEAVAQFWDLRDPHGLVTGIMEGAVRARALIAAQTDAVRSAISNAVAAGMDEFRLPDGTCRVPMPALVGSASK